MPTTRDVPSLAEIAREWGRIGSVGFGGPPAHIALFRDLCVTRRGWLTEEQFERAIAATNLLPGRPPRSSRSTAHGGCAGLVARSSAVSASSCPASR